MRVNSIENKTSFGWRFKTHEKITSLVLEDFPKLAEHKETLMASVIKPDFDERGFKGNNHFYYPREVLRPRESFLDIFGQNNAAARYAVHMYEFNRLINKNNDKAMEHAGRALHFLQDVTQPQHTERGTVFKKWRDLRIHKEFENFVQNNQDRIITQVLEEIPKRGDWYKQYGYGERDELFNLQVSASMEIMPANKKNRLFWEYIAQFGLTNAVDATKAFFNIVSECIK